MSLRRKTKSWIKIFDSEPLNVRVPGYFYLGCCDCGLTHQVIIKSAGKNRIELAFVRDIEDNVTAIRKTQNIKVIKKGKRV